MTGTVPGWAAGAAQDALHTNFLRRVAAAAGGTGCAAQFVAEDPWWNVLAPPDEMYSSGKAADRRAPGDLYAAYWDWDGDTGAEAVADTVIDLRDDAPECGAPTDW